jgi:inhibitor of KinA sporulation pathway (predicted exonuclease)
MANKLDDMKARLAELGGERAQLDTTIEEMIADLAELAPEQRSAGDWAPDGASTRKYLELTRRQAAVETEIIDLNRAIVEADEPSSPPH